MLYHTKKIWRDEINYFAGNCRMFSQKLPIIFIVNAHEHISNVAGNLNHYITNKIRIICIIKHIEHALTINKFVNFSNDQINFFLVNFFCHFLILLCRLCVVRDRVSFDVWHAVFFYKFNSIILHGRYQKFMRRCSDLLAIRGRCEWLGVGWWQYFGSRILRKIFMLRSVCGRVMLWAIDW